MSRRILRLVAAFSFVFAFTVGAPTLGAYAQSDNAGIASEAITGPIQAADTIKVVVADTDEFGGEFRVDPDGTVTIPEVGTVPVQGLMPTAAASRIADHIVARGLLKTAAVTLTVVGRRPHEVTINGAVTTQGRQRIHDGTLLSEAIETAGLQPAADLSRVVIRRGDQTMTVDYKQFRNGTANTPEVNPVLEDGDRIYIYSSAPSEGTVRIVGEVKDATKPLMPITAGTTVGQAIQQAGGITDYADRNGIVVVRGTQTIPVAYQDIARGAPGRDLVLQDRDEIRIPRLDRPHAFTVAGAVRTPNTYPLNTQTSLLQAVAEAGGPQDGARVNQVLLRRPLPNGMVATRMVNLDRDADAAIPVQDGDYIEVPFARRRPDATSTTGGLVGILSGLAVIFGVRH